MMTTAMMQQKRTTNQTHDHFVDFVVVVLSAILFCEPCHDDRWVFLFEFNQQVALSNLWSIFGKLKVTRNVFL